jgi:hypothetical protein
MNTNYDPKKLRPEKKGTVIWPAMFFEPPEKITTPPKKCTVVWPTVEINLRWPSVVSKYKHTNYNWKEYERKKRYDTRLLCQNTNTTNHTLIGMAHLVGCCVCVCCVLCFMLQPTTRWLYLFFSSRNFFQFCNNTTDGYLRFISTVGQTTLNFFWGGRNFSSCNLNPPKNMAGQTTVLFFLVVFFSGRM